MPPILPEDYNYLAGSSNFPQTYWYYRGTSAKGPGIYYGKTFVGSVPEGTPVEEAYLKANIEPAKTSEGGTVAEDVRQTVATQVQQQQNIAKIEEAFIEVGINPFPMQSAQYVSAETRIAQKFGLPEGVKILGATPTGVVGPYGSFGNPYVPTSHEKFMAYEAAYGQAKAERLAAQPAEVQELYKQLEGYESSIISSAGPTALRTEYQPKLYAPSGTGKYRSETGTVWTTVGGVATSMNEQARAEAEAKRAEMAANLVTYGSLGNVVYNEQFSRILALEGEKPFSAAAGFAGTLPLKQIATPEEIAATGGDVTKLLQVYGEKRQTAIEQGDIAARREYEFRIGALGTNLVADIAKRDEAAKIMGLPIAPSRKEYQMDLYMEMLKGTPKKASEEFSPVSGELLGILPQRPKGVGYPEVGGYGLQEYGWDYALAVAGGETELVQRKEFIKSMTPPDYLPAIKYIVSKEGEAGPYGRLEAWSSVGGKLSVEQQQEIAKKSIPFPLFGEIAGGPVTKLGIFEAIDQSFKTDIGRLYGAKPTLLVEPLIISATVEPKSISTKEAAPEVVMVRAPDMTMQPDYMVPFGNVTAQSTLKGGKVIASTATVIPIPSAEAGEEAIARGKLPAPFISGQVTRPKGEIFGREIWGISPILAFFQPGEMRTIRKTKTTIPETTTFIGTQTIPTETGTLTTEKFLVSGRESIQTAEKVTSTPSGYESWISSANKGVSQALGFDKIPTPTKEEIKTMAPQIAASPLPGAAPFGLVLMAPGISDYAAAYLSGEIKAIKERPVEAGASFVMGVGFGIAFKGLEKGLGVARAAAASRIMSEGQTWAAAELVSGTAMKAAPTILGGLYAADIGLRATGEGRGISPAAAERLGEIAAIEARPMVAGSIIGFEAPSTVYRAGREIQIGYRQKQLEIASERSQLLQVPVSRQEITIRDVLKQELYPRYAEARFKAGQIASGEIPGATVEAGTVRIGGAEDYLRAFQKRAIEFPEKISARASEFGIQISKAPAKAEAAINRAYLEMVYGKSKPIAPEIQRPTIAPEEEFISGYVYGKQPLITELPARAKIAAKSYIQERIQPEGAAIFYLRPGLWLPGGAGPKMGPEISKGAGAAGAAIAAGPGTGGEGGTRVITKPYGGRQISTLAPEPSLKSMGIKESAIAGRTTITESRMIDYRGQPASKTMKPMDLGRSTKQAAAQISIMREPLPAIEGMPKTGIAPQAQRTFFAPQALRPQYVEEEIVAQEIRPRFAAQARQVETPVIKEQQQRLDQQLRQFQSVATAQTRIPRQAEFTRFARDVATSRDITRISERELARREGQRLRTEEIQSIVTIPAITTTTRQEFRQRQTEIETPFPDMGYRFRHIEFPKIPVLPTLGYPGSSGPGVRRPGFKFTEYLSFTRGRR